MIHAIDEFFAGLLFVISFTSIGLIVLILLLAIGSWLIVHSLRLTLARNVKPGLTKTTSRRRVPRWGLLVVGILIIGITAGLFRIRHEAMLYPGPSLDFSQLH